MRRQFQLKERRERPVVARVFVACFTIFALVVLTFIIVHEIADRKFETMLYSELTEDVRYQSVNGTSLAYRVHGSGEETILLIHGLMGSSYDFAALWPDLSQKRTVVSVDLIGFGLSDKNPELDYSKENMALLCGQLMLDLGYEQFDVLGHSMGGEVAMNVAVSYRQHVQKLILIDSAGANDLQRGFQHSIPVWLIEHVAQNFLVQRLYFPAAFASRDQATAALFNQFYFFNRQIPGETLQKLITDNDSGRLKNQLNRIEQQTLVIWGRDDKIIPLEQGHQLNQALPDSQLVVIDRAGHIPFIERPAEVLQAVNTFLNETRQAQSS